MIDDQTTFAPFVIFEYDHEPGLYCLLLTDDRMLAIAAVFEEHGANGNGYGWAQVVRRSVHEHAPEIADQIGLDPEAGLLAVRSRDLGALRRLGALLRDAYHDQSRLAALIEPTEAG